MRKSRGELKGLQFFSYAQLARDIFEWSKRLRKGYYRAVVGVPRSGLTCAHMLSVHLNCPCVQIHAPQFRQSTGRKLDSGDGPFLVVDDTASYGTTMREIRQQMKGTPAEFAAVYARQVSWTILNHWYGVHEDPDTLVLTEWNWNRHQDAEYIATTSEVVQAGWFVPEGVDAVYDASDSLLASKYKRSMAAALFALSDCQQIANESGKAVVDVSTMNVVRPDHVH